MNAKDWVVANKVKTGLGIVAGLAAVIALPVSFVSWAEGQTANQIHEAGLIQQGRVEAVQTVQARELQKQSAKHDYDFYEIRALQAEEQLFQLEEDSDAGVQLTSSQKRKMRRLENQVENFQSKQDEALEKLTVAEAQSDNET